MNTRNFKEIQDYLLKEECVTSEYDNDSFTVLEFGSWENKLENIGIKEDNISVKDKVKIMKNLQKRFKFAEIEMHDTFDVGFDFTLLKEDVNCNLKYILNAIHSFHNAFQKEVQCIVKQNIQV